MRHPVADVVHVARDQDAILVVDAIASVGVEEVAVDGNGIDAIVTASQKGLECPAGLAIVALGSRARSLVESRRLAFVLVLRFTNWDRARRESFGWEPSPVTLPTSLVLSVMMNAERIVQTGLSARVLERTRLRRRLVAGLEKLSLRPIAIRSSRSNLVTVVRVDRPQKMAERLLAQHGSWSRGACRPWSTTLFGSGWSGPTRTTHPWTTSWTV